MFFTSDSHSALWLQLLQINLDPKAVLFVVDTIAAFAAVMSHTLLITVVAILPPAIFAYGKGVEFVLALELVRQRVGFSFILIKGAWAGLVSAF
jgi:hypothetical protein